MTESMTDAPVTGDLAPADAPAATGDSVQATVNPRILMVAFQFPPWRGSSGIQRTLAFTRYLGGFGWDPVILSAHPRAYPRTGDDQVAEIPETVPVRRAFAIDAKRHLNFFGWYPSLAALPDRWASWAVGGVLAGLGLVRKHRPSVIWSTYPIATAHLVGSCLSRITGIPYVADFRDSMTEEDYPLDPTQRRVYRWIERMTVSIARRVIFTTPGARQMYAERYPERPPETWNVIANGYNEDNFRGAAGLVDDPPRGQAPNKLKLLHSGILYPSERDPTQFFEAIAALKRDGQISSDGLEIVLRSTGYDDIYSVRLKQLEIDDVVTLAPSVPYREALAEMCSADGLLLFQAANCNHQIPAKVYEYLRAQRPIIALTDPEGDTASVLRDANFRTIARLDSKEEIMRELSSFLEELRGGNAFTAPLEEVERYSRRQRTAELARLLTSLTSEPTGQSQENDAPGTPGT